MSNYEEEWRTAIKKGEYGALIDRIVPVETGIKVVYKKQIVCEPPKKTIELPIVIDISIPFDEELLHTHIAAVKRSMELYVEEEKKAE